MALGLSHGGTTIYSTPSRSNEVWVGTTEGLVVIERDANGAGWHVTRRLLTDKHISAILTEPGSGLTFVGAFHGSLQVTGDGGRTWETRNAGLTEHDVYSLGVRAGQRSSPSLFGHGTRPYFLQRRPWHALERIAGAAVGAERIEMEVSGAAPYRTHKAH